MFIVVAVAASLAFLFAHVPTAEASGANLVVDNFSGDSGDDGSPAGWKPFILSKIKRLTSYIVLKQGNGYVLKASSAQAASGIYKELDLDLREYPVLSWRWKVSGVLKNGNALKKSGDDFSARVYVAFEFEPEKASRIEKIKYMALKSIYGENLPGKAITYIWANRLEKGKVTPNPFLGQSMMIAVESGPEHVNRWVQEERNVYEDFRRCFNDDPPRVTGIIIMTDTDNTGENATAYYDDIVFKRRQPKENRYSLSKEGAKGAEKASTTSRTRKRAGI